MDLKKIQEHWENAGEAIDTNASVIATSRDPYLGQLEENYILKYLNKGMSVLEVGCGDGSHTISYANVVNKINGLDIAGSLIKVAQARAEHNNICNIDLNVGSVLNVDELYKGNEFDGIISQRCLINLPTWQHQKEAIIKLHGLLKKDGVLILTEGFQDELDNLNIIRCRAGLERINVVDYNRNFCHDEFDTFINEYFEIITTYNYGLYLFLSRIYYPLAIFPEQPKHDSKMNQIAAQCAYLMENSSVMRHLSYNLFYVLKKK